MQIFFNGDFPLTQSIVGYQVKDSSFNHLTIKEIRVEAEKVDKYPRQQHGLLTEVLGIRI